MRRILLLVLLLLAGWPAHGEAVYKGFRIPNRAAATFVEQSYVYEQDTQIIADGEHGNGVIDGGASDCAVSAQGSPDMTLAVAGCTAYQQGVSITVAAGNVTISAAHATLPRIDLVSVSSAGVKTVTTGTAATVPLPPTIPQSSSYNNVVLAMVYVPAADTAINANQITDKRIFVLAPGAGGGAPTTAHSVTTQAEAGLSAESSLGALTTGLLLNTVAAGVGTLSAYGGSGACSAGDFISALDASGAKTCGTPAGSGTVTHTAGPLTLNQVVIGNAAADLKTLGTLGTTTTLLHGNAAGAPSFGAVVSGDLNITTTTCSNQFVSAISSAAAGTCTSATLASAQFANQGTTTTLLHGNAAGNPSFGSVVSADHNITPTSCTNQFLTAISSTVGGTCSTATLAGAQFANQGTTTTVLHGNAAGNPSFGAVALGTDVSGTLAAAQFPTLTGDVTTPGASLTTTLANIPSATPMAGSLLATAIAAPGTPAAGKGSIYVDSTSKNLSVKDDAGVVKHGVQTITCGGSDFVKSVSDAGLISCATPAGSGTVTTTGTPANGNLTKFTGATSISNADLSGDVTTSGTVATTIANNAVTTVKILDANVTKAKIENVAADRLLGRGNGGGAGAPQELSLAAGLTLSGTTLTPEVTSSSSTVLTNKTLDAEGTGNLISIPDKVWLPAAGCNNATAGTVWDLPTTTPAVPACVTGTNTQKGVLDFADTTGGFSAQNIYYLPADWTTTGGVDVDLLWTTTATSGNAKWTVQFVCTDVAASATDDPAFPTAGNNGHNTVTTAAPGTSPRVQISTITGATLPASCVSATREILHVRLFRDGNDGSDTISATARFIGMTLTYRRAM